MNGFEPLPAYWTFIAIQVIGAASACLARLSEGSRRQALCQLAFFAILPLLGAASLVSMAVGPGCWICCSVTLAFAVLMVTCDFRSGSKAATW